MSSEYQSVQQDVVAAMEENRISQRSFEQKHLLPSTPAFEPLSIDFETALSGNVSPVSTTSRPNVVHSVHGDDFGNALHQMASSSHTSIDEEEQSEKGKDTRGSTTALLYSPFFLRKSVLMIFALACLVMIIVLGILYAVSHHNHGLGSPSENLHLLWKYGPTAVMHSKDAGAEESVLLDYVDPMGIISLFKSVRAAHWPVSLAITGGLLLKLAIIFSSGLLDLEVIQVQETSPDLMADYQFDTNNYSLSSIDGAPYSNWYAIQNFNLTYPVGTTPTQAYQFFNLSSPPKNFDLSGLSMSGIANQFSAHLTCQPLLDRLNYSYTFDVEQNLIPYNGVQVNLTNNDNLGYYMLDIASPSCNAPLQVETQYFGSMYLVNCSTGLTTISWNGLAEMQTRDKSQDQVIFAFRGLVQNYTQLTAVLCQPSYNLGNSQISLPYSQEILPPDIGTGTNGKFADLSALDVLDAFRAAVELQPPDLKQDFENSPLGDYFFTVLNVTDHHTSNWVDPAILSQNISNIYSSFTAQIARRVFTVSSNSSIQGTITGDSNRLMVQSLSMALIVAALSITMFVATALTFVAPRGTTSRDPSTIAGLASIVSQSPDFMQFMLGKGQLDRSSLLDHTKHSRYRTNMDVGGEDPQFKVDVVEFGEKEPKTLPPSSETNIKWWKPYSTTIVNKVLIVALLSMFITLLEILYRLSQRRDGLASVPDNDYVKLAWSYVPVTAVVILGMLLGGFDFTMRIIQPYLALRKGNASAATSVLDDQLNRLAPSRLWSAMRTIQFTAIASTTAVLLVHVLTIAVSGLYVAELKPQIIPNITISQLDALDGSQLVNDSATIPSAWNDGFAVTINRESLPGLVL
ncbi:uncharacterized protein LY89DRAFT_727542 [Mollisia scopiformis]|uniref:Uncharacterized protein n=1 Tax=Mollisia scopiformis TaxID=149040 RepID=A0A194XW30_MOLSC|nr:uncharacterized protein LY89DRAFT_727542 [Mollisia scopiformis]KUJ24520.1 hypothetical protein LY89DRAFT_727542 [Mollisia scopiformis]